MPAPSQLKIATDAVNRLARELTSYYKELELQEKKIAAAKDSKATEGDDENAEYLARQHEKAAEETRTTIPSIRSKLTQSVEALDREMENSSSSASEEEINKAKSAKESAAVAEAKSS